MYYRPSFWFQTGVRGVTSSTDWLGRQTVSFDRLHFHDRHLSRRKPSYCLSNLRTLLKKRRGYGILYLAFHGSPGKILLNGSSLSIETLAEIMGKGFTNWVVYFGSCATINVKEDRILNFMESTGILMVMGYDRPIDWLSSTALDLFLLDSVQSYRDMRKFWNFFRRNYQGMMEVIGLKAFHK